MAIQQKADFAEAYFNLGSASENEGKPEEAIAMFHAAIQLKPDYAEAQCHVGRLLLERKDYGGAGRALEAAPRAKPDFVDAHYALGRLLVAEGYREKAAAEFEQVQRLNQRREKAMRAIQLSNQGLELAQKGDLQGGISLLRQATEVEPGYALANQLT
jgi:tetratricopeptide (TPR) repeat protein